MADKQTPEEQQADGVLDKAKGRAKEAYGALADDTGKRLEGQVDQVKGEAKQEVGKAREKARKKI